MKIMTKAEVLEVLDNCLAYIRGKDCEALTQARAAVSEVYEELDHFKTVGQEYADEAQKWSNVIFDLRAEVERLKRAVDRKDNKLKYMLRIFSDPNFTDRYNDADGLRKAIAYTGDPT